VKVGGICGATAQACAEAGILRDLRYDAGLLSLGALPGASDAQLLAHCRAVGEIVPLMGFYLQPAVGGRALGYDFWRRFSEIESVVAIKVAPFNRYQTIDVLRGVAAGGRAKEIALYTGNDDNIVGDLLMSFHAGSETLRFAGGLLGQWAVWTKRAVELLEEVQCAKKQGERIAALLGRGMEITDANAAIFDARNGFRGCIPGIHEILRRQGLLAGRIGGSVPLFLFGTALYRFAMTSLGIFLATVGGTMPQFGLLMMLVLMPLQMLSGATTPRESMPEIIQNIMLAAPNTHFVILAQAVLFRGAGLDVVWPQLVALQ